LKVREALLEGAARLAGKSATPNLDAELILCWLRDWDRIQTILKADEVLQPDDEIRYSELIEERRAGRPVQYITGRQEFMGMLFCVDSRVLIPRPDTENLVEAVLERLKGVVGARVLDLCTGSGAIAVSLARYLEGAEVIGTDLSGEALEVARENGNRLVPGANLRWLQGDLYDALGSEAGLFDAIVSNPPYIAREVIETLEPNVRDYEPYGALDGGETGLDFYPLLVAGAGDRLAPGGLLALEIGWDQGAAVCALLEEDGRFQEVELLKDLAGRDRVVCGKRRAVSGVR